MSHKDSNYDSQVSSKNRSPEQDEGSLSSQGKSPAGYGDRQVIQQQEMGGELGSVNPPQQEQDNSTSPSSQPGESSPSDSSSMSSPSQSEQSESSSMSEYSEESSIEQSKSYSSKKEY